MNCTVKKFIKGLNMHQINQDVVVAYRPWPLTDWLSSGARWNLGQKPLYHFCHSRKKKICWAKLGNLTFKDFPCEYHDTSPIRGLKSKVQVISKVCRIDFFLINQYMFFSHLSTLQWRCLKSAITSFVSYILKISRIYPITLFVRETIFFALKVRLFNTVISSSSHFPFISYNESYFM